MVLDCCRIWIKVDQNNIITAQNIYHNLFSSLGKPQKIYIVCFPEKNEKNSKYIPTHSYFFYIFLVK